MLSEILKPSEHTTPDLNSTFAPDNTTTQTVFSETYLCCILVFDNFLCYIFTNNYLPPVINDGGRASRLGAVLVTLAGMATGIAYKWF